MGWIVDKWSNNVEFQNYHDYEDDGFKMSLPLPKKIGKLIPAKRKFNPFKKVMSIGTGFPDFIAFREVIINLAPPDFKKVYEVIGIEAKSNGYLDPEERAKCEWMLKNHIFSKILIAKKGGRRGEIVYNYYVQFEGGHHLHD